MRWWTKRRVPTVSAKQAWFMRWDVELRSDQKPCFYMPLPQETVLPAVLRSKLSSSGSISFSLCIFAKQLRKLPGAVERKVFSIFISDISLILKTPLLISSTTLEVGSEHRSTIPSPIQLCIIWVSPAFSALVAATVRRYRAYFELHMFILTWMCQTVPIFCPCSTLFKIFKEKNTWRFVIIVDHR